MVGLAYPGGRKKINYSVYKLAEKKHPVRLPKKRKRKKKRQQNYLVSFRTGSTQENLVVCVEVLWANHQTNPTSSQCAFYGSLYYVHPPADHGEDWDGEPPQSGKKQTSNECCLNLSGSLVLTLLWECNRWLALLIVNPNTNPDRHVFFLKVHVTCYISDIDTKHFLPHCYPQAGNVKKRDWNDGVLEVNYISEILTTV